MTIFRSVWEDRVWRVRQATGAGAGNIHDPNFVCELVLTRKEPASGTEFHVTPGKMPPLWDKLVLKPSGNYHLEWDVVQSLPDWNKLTTPAEQKTYLTRVVSHLNDTKCAGNPNVMRLSGVDQAGKHRASLFWIPDAIDGDEDLLIIDIKDLSGGGSQDGTGHGDKR